MLPLYLFALIVGGGLLLFSLLTGGEDTEIEAVEGDGLEGLEAEDAGESPWEGVQDFLSVRTLLYLMAGFGASGTLIGLLTGAGPIVTLVWALMTGLLAALMSSAVYRWVRRTDSGVVPREPDYLVGATARVLLPVRSEARGKIVAVQGGREVELLARLFDHDEAPCPRGSEVVIVDIDGDTALVAALPLLPSDFSSE
jgi:membrane protein implicated in regulation of membrane protease activity